MSVLTTRTRASFTLNSVHELSQRTLAWKKKLFWQSKFYFIDNFIIENYQRFAFSHFFPRKIDREIKLTSLVSSLGWKKHRRWHHKSRPRPPNSSMTSPALKDETFLSIVINLLLKIVFSSFSHVHSSLSHPLFVLHTK